MNAGRVGGYTDGGNRFTLKIGSQQTSESESAVSVSFC